MRACGEPPDAVCPACGGPLARWYTVPGGEPALGARRFALWRCGACGSAVTAGDPPSAQLYDTGAYRPGTPRLHGVARPLLDSFDRRRLALLGRLVAPPARVIDVGAGQGRFVAAARAAGYDASGLEPSARGRGRAAALGVELLAAGIEDAEIGPESLDAATVWHVLEHVAEPGAALEHVARWLRPGGGLVLGVPNLASWQARLGAERWYHLDVPRHRTHFTAAGACALVGRAGFQVVSVHHVLLEHNPFGMWQSAVSRLTQQPSYLYQLLKRNVPLRPHDAGITAAAIPLVPVAALAELAAGLARHGGTIAVLARRC